MDLRAEFPVCARLAYLNAGTCGPLPARAGAAASAELEREVADGRSGQVHFRHRFELMGALRAAYAERLGCPPGDVALTTSTSEGVATALLGMDLRAGDEILTSDSEHPGLIGPVQAVRDLRGTTVRAVPLADLPDAVGPHTRVIACSHVSWVTGEVAPAGLGEVGVPVVLDGAQGIGALDFDVGALGCAAYAGSGQKWLCGPEGTGMLHVAPAAREEIGALRRSYVSYVDGAYGLDAELHPDARRYDAPVIPSFTLAGALAAHEVLDAAGWDAVYARARTLAGTLADALRERGHEVMPRGPTTLVAWRAEDAEAEVARLADAGVVIRWLPGRGLLRASVGAWNDEGDLERLLDAL
jgi:selenocysteine lyase/cysteine desulfurase